MCEFHCVDEDSTTTLVRGKKKVLSRRDPSIFREQSVKQKATRLPPNNRFTSKTESDEVLSSSSSSAKKESSKSFIEEFF